MARNGRIRKQYGGISALEQATIAAEKYPGSYGVLRGGWPDFLVIPDDGSSPFAIEVKSRRGRVEPHQEKMHAALKRLGIEVKVIRALQVEKIAKRHTTSGNVDTMR